MPYETIWDGPAAYPRRYYARFVRPFHDANLAALDSFEQLARPHAPHGSEEETW